MNNIYTLITTSLIISLLLIMILTLSGDYLLYKDSTWLNLFIGLTIVPFGLLIQIIMLVIDFLLFLHELYKDMKKENIRRIKEKRRSTDIVKYKGENYI